MTEQTPVVSNFNPLTEFLQKIDESEARSVIDTITYNVQSQTFVIQVRDLLRREEENIEASRLLARAPQKISAAEAIKELSSAFSDKFPELLHYYRAWIPAREDLIKESKNSGDKLERNAILCSMTRILTSSSDLVSTWKRFYNSKSSWVQFALENASLVNFVSFFIEKTLSKRMFNKIKILMETDQELFQPIKKWFQQCKELDTAVRNFFPYGIDEDLVLKINKSAANSDEYTKIFMSIIASNARKEIKLFKDMDFLDRADKFSTSDAGVTWYRKVLIQNDPVYIECFKSDLEEDIKAIMKKISKNSATDRPETLLDTTLLLSSRVRTKILLNALSIFSASSNIWDGGETEESRDLRKLAEKTKKELKGMKDVLDLLKPDGTEIDEYLK